MVFRTGLTPSALALLEPEAAAFPALRCVVAWGEACPAKVAERWGAAALPWAFRDLLIATEYWLALVAGPERDGGGRSAFRAVDGVCVSVRRLDSALAIPAIFKSLLSLISFFFNSFNLKSSFMFFIFNIFIQLSRRLPRCQAAALPRASAARGSRPRLVIYVIATGALFQYRFAIVSFLIGLAL